MGRQELYITLPTLFRCPISMEVMKSPVSLCTGVTYDRSSIQHWLESGHDTCPATMQILPSKNFVPNLTLHRLIHLWLNHHHYSSSPKSPASSSQQVRIFVDKIGSDNGDGRHFRDYLKKIVNFAKFSNQNRSFLAGLDGFVEVIVGVLSNTNEIEVLELVIRVLDLVISENGIQKRLQTLVFKSNQNCFSPICLLLRNGSLLSKIETARVLESLTLDADAESKRRIAEKEDDLLSVLFHTLSSEKDPSLHDAVLSCLIAISVTRSVKAELVRLGLVRVLSETLILNPNTSASATEKSLKLLSILSKSAEGRSAISEDAKCAAAIVERLMKAGTEDAVTVLWSLCCFHGDRKVKDAVVKSNGMTKILLVMQRECEGNVRRMCGELLKVLRVGCSKPGGGLGRYETKTTHIMPC